MKKVIIILFILIPAVIASIVFIKPDTAVSDNENRSLETRSGISHDVFGGGFQDGLEKLLSDQLPYREALITLKSDFDYALGKREIGGAYILGDKRLVQKITDTDFSKSALVSYADTVNKIAETVPTFVMYVPSAEVCLKSSLPDGAPVYDYEALYGELSLHLENTVLIDLLPSLQGREDAFYKTDHHWNYNGAYLAYEAWCDARGNTPSSFTEKMVSDGFRGTLYSKALLSGTPYDELIISDENLDLSVNADGKEIELFDLSALDTKDKYNVFQGGNHGIVTIENRSQSNGKTLLILKDSFANSFVPFIVKDYSKIIMLDERYTFISLGDFVKQSAPDEIAVIREIIN